MTNFTDLPSGSPDHLVPFTDQLRVAVAAYLARFKGSSRYHTESDLRCFLAWCAERDLDPLAARRPHLELYLRWMQEIRRFKPSTVSRRFSVTARFYRTCVIDGLLDRSPARARAPAVGFCGVTDAGVHPPPIRGTAHHGPGVLEPLRLRAGSHARAARVADLRSHWRGHRRPRRRTRPSGAAHMRQRDQGRADPAAASGRAGHRRRDRHP